MNRDYETIEDKERKAITLSHLALISSLIKPDSKELEVSQAKIMPTEECIDGWAITYKKLNHESPSGLSSTSTMHQATIPWTQGIQLRGVFIAKEKGI